MIIAPCECPNACTTSPGSAPARVSAASVASYEAERSPVYSAIFDSMSNGSVLFGATVCVPAT